ncbi:hypothetical protein CYMTET_49412, partial [Cymbomonas tetramitiformis]
MFVEEVTPRRGSAAPQLRGAGSSAQSHRCLLDSVEAKNGLPVAHSAVVPSHSFSSPDLTGASTNRSAEAQVTTSSRAEGESQVTPAHVFSFPAAHSPHSPNQRRKLKFAAEASPPKQPFQ